MFYNTNEKPEGMNPSGFFCGNVALAKVSL